MSNSSPLDEYHSELVPVDKGAGVSPLDQTITDELLRGRIRRASKQAEHPQSALEKLSKNPLFGIVVGFLLTWGVGTILTNNYRDAREASEKDKQSIEKRRDLNVRGVNELSRIMYERRTATVMLASSLFRNAPLAELTKRKGDYDSAFVKWNRELQVTQLTIRGMVEENKYSEVESYVQYGLVPHFTRLDEALTAAYDAKLHSPHEPTAMKSSDISGDLSATLDCAYCITNYLWTIANPQIVDKDGRQPQESAKQELEKRCPKH
jgi:hypothetical protein